MKKHQSLLEYVSPNKRRRTNAIHKDGGHERQLNKQQQRNNAPTICCWMDYESIESTQCFSSKTMTHHSNIALPSTMAINTEIATSITTEIFLSRLHKEIIQPFRFTLSSQIQLLDSDRSVHDATERRHVIQKRILLGYNEVSKLLFDSNIGKTTKPSLIVIVNPDYVYRNDSQQQQQHPSSTSTIGAAMLQHIPLLSFQMNIPLLLLPSSYKSENYPRGKVGTETITTLQALATTFGCGHYSDYNDMKHFSCIAFTNHDQSRQHQHNFNTGIVLGVTDDDLMEYKQNEHLIHIHNIIDSFVSYITNKIQN